MSEAWLATFGDGTSETIEVAQYFGRGWVAYDSRGERGYALGYDSSHKAASEMASGISRLRNTYVASLSPTQRATIGGASLSQPIGTYSEGFADGHRHGISSAADTLREAAGRVARSQHPAVARLLCDAADAAAKEVEAQQPRRYADDEISRERMAEREACARCIRSLADGKPMRDAAMLRLAATIMLRCRESGAMVINASISYPTDADGRAVEDET